MPKHLQRLVGRSYLVTQREKSNIFFLLLLRVVFNFQRNPREPLVLRMSTCQNAFKWTKQVEGHTEGDIGGGGRACPSKQTFCNLSQHHRVAHVIPSVHSMNEKRMFDVSSCPHIIFLEKKHTFEGNKHAAIVGWHALL